MILSHEGATGLCGGCPGRGGTDRIRSITSLFGYTLRSSLLIAAIAVAAAATSSVVAASVSGDLSGRVAGLLVAHGFENVSAGRDGDQLNVSYENRIYRSEVSAMGAVLALAFGADTAASCINLIPRSRDVPMIAIRVRRSDYEAFVNSTAGAAYDRRPQGDPPRSSLQRAGFELEDGPSNAANRAFAARLSFSQRWSAVHPSRGDRSTAPSLNRSSWKADIVVRPGVAASFGISGDWARLQFNLIPMVAVSLPGHLQAVTQVIAPMYDELHSLDRSSNEVRLGSTTLTRAARIPGGIVAATTAGYFDLGKYGIALEASRLFLGGNLTLGGQAGRVGYLNSREGIWYYSSIVSNVYLVTLKYAFPVVDFYISGAYGRFLFGDAGWRMDFLRTFSELDLGFFGIKSGGKLLGGIRISVPLFPSRHPAFSGRVRLRSPVSFPWSYRYRPENGGYLLSNAVENFQKRLIPEYIRNNVREIRRQATEMGDGSAQTGYRQ